jgi:hypothetical protein
MENKLIVLRVNGQRTKANSSETYAVAKVKVTKLLIVLSF